MNKVHHKAFEHISIFIIARIDLRTQNRWIIMKEKEALIHFKTQFVLLLLYIIESFIGKNIEPKEQRVSIGKKALNRKNNALVLEKRH